MAIAAVRTTPPVDAEVWLSVQDASAMLGVSPATLRRWSAAGEVEAFTTPGGHRRFALSTLRALLPHSGTTPVRLAALGESAERMTKVIRRHARAAAHESPWIRELDEASRERLRGHSRALIEGIVDQLDASTHAAREAAAQRSAAAAVELAREASRLGASLPETFGVFLRFRSLIVAELSAVAVRRGLTAADATSLVTRGGDAVDRLLTAVMDALESR